MANDWKRIEDAARYATVVMCGEWSAQASLREGTIEGPMLFTPPGALSSRLDDKTCAARMIARMRSAGAADPVPQAFANPVCAAWSAWTRDYVLAMPCFPSFAAMPTPVAPPTPNAPFPLAAGLSLAPLALRPDRLEQDIAGALGTVADEEGARTAVRRFAVWLAVGFEAWAASTHLVGAFGTGPVPMFAPPYMPVAPVIHGWLVSGGFLFGPTFGAPLPASSLPIPPGAPWPPPGSWSLPGFPGLPTFPGFPGLPSLPAFPSFPIPGLPGGPSGGLPDFAGATGTGAMPSWPTPPAVPAIPTPTLPTPPAVPAIPTPTTPTPPAPPAVGLPDPRPPR